MQGETRWSWFGQSVGGPKVETPAGPNGYGSKLASRTMSGHLGGSIDYDWDEAGVIVTLRMMKARLAQ